MKQITHKLWLMRSQAAMLHETVWIAAPKMNSHQHVFSEWTSVVRMTPESCASSCVCDYMRAAG